MGRFNVLENTEYNEDEVIALANHAAEDPGWFSTHVKQFKENWLKVGGGSRIEDAYMDTLASPYGIAVDEEDPFFKQFSFHKHLEEMQQEERYRKITEEEWRNSEHYRDGTEFKEGWTTPYAAYIAKRYDDMRELERMKSYGHVGWWGDMGNMLIAQIVDPDNIVAMKLPVPGEARLAMLTEKYGVKLGAKVIGEKGGEVVGKYAAKTATGAYSNILVGAPSEYTAYQHAKRIQSDYELEDYLKNAFFYGPIAGAAFNVGTGIIKDVGKKAVGRLTKSSELLKKLETERIEQAKKEMAAEEKLGIDEASQGSQDTAKRVAVAQTLHGESVDVGPIFEINRLEQKISTAEDILKGRKSTDDFDWVEYFGEELTPEEKALMGIQETPAGTVTEKGKSLRELAKEKVEMEMKEAQVNELQEKQKRVVEELNKIKKEHGLGEPTKIEPKKGATAEETLNEILEQQKKINEEADRVRKAHEEKISKEDWAGPAKVEPTAEAKTTYAEGVEKMKITPKKVYKEDGKVFNDLDSLLQYREDKKLAEWKAKKAASEKARKKFDKAETKLENLNDDLLSSTEKMLKEAEERRRGKFHRETITEKAQPPIGLEKIKIMRLVEKIKNLMEGKHEEIIRKAIDKYAEAINAPKGVIGYAPKESKYRLDKMKQINEEFAALQVEMKDNPDALREVDRRIRSISEIGNIHKNIINDTIDGFSKLETPNTIKAVLETRYETEMKHGAVSSENINDLVDHIDQLINIKYRNELTPKLSKKIRNQLVSKRENQILNDIRAEIIQTTSNNRLLKRLMYTRENGNIDEFKVAEAYMVGTSRDIEGIGNNVDAHIISTQAELIGKFLTRLSDEDPGLAKRLLDKDPRLYRDFCVEMNALTEQGPNAKSITINAHAKKMADIYDSVKREVMALQNEAGANKAYKNGWGTHVTHMAYKIAKDSPEDWVAFISSKLDLEAMHGDIEIPIRIKEWLLELHDDLVNGNTDHYRRGLHDDGNLGTAAKLSKSRRLIWKSGEAMYEYSMKYGESTLFGAIYRDLVDNGRAIALMERFGPEPRKGLDVIKEFLIDGAENNPKLKRSLKGKLERLDDYFNELTGIGTGSITNIAAKSIAAMRNLEVVTKLVSLPLAMVGDPPTMMRSLRYHGYGMFESIIKPLVDHGLFGTKGKIQKEIASDVGIILEHWAGQTYSRMNAFGSPAGLTSRLVNWTMIYNLANGLTHTLRGAQLRRFAYNLGRHYNIEWKNLSGDFKRILRMYNLGEERWNIIRKHTKELRDGRRYLMPKYLDEITDNEIRYMMKTDNRPIYREIVKGSISDLHVREYRKSLNRDMRSFFINEMNGAVVTPGAKHRVKLHQGTSPDTAVGQIARSITQFMAWGMAFIDRGVKREWIGRSGTLNRISGSASLFAFMTVSGMIMNALRDVRDGRVPAIKYIFTNDWKQNIELVWRGVLSGGGLGIYGDIMAAITRSYGKGPVETFSGPAAETTNEIFEFGPSIWNWLTNEEDEESGVKLAKKGAKFIKKHTPFINIWYAKWATDFLFNHVAMEFIDPGYKERLDEKIEERTNQETISNYIRRNF